MHVSERSRAFRSALVLPCIAIGVIWDLATVSILIVIGVLGAFAFALAAIRNAVCFYLTKP